MRLKTYNFQDKDLYMNYSGLIYEGGVGSGYEVRNRKQKASGKVVRSVDAVQESLAVGSVRVGATGEAGRDPVVSVAWIA